MFHGLDVFVSMSLVALLVRGRSSRNAYLCAVMKFCVAMIDCAEVRRTLFLKKRVESSPARVIRSHHLLRLIVCVALGQEPSHHSLCFGSALSLLRGKVDWTSRRQHWVRWLTPRLALCWCIALKRPGSGCLRCRSISKRGGSAPLELCF